MQLVTLFQVKIIKWNRNLNLVTQISHETVLDVSETDLKVTSSPKSNKSDKSKTIPTSEETKVDQNVISSIYVIEVKVCQLSSTFE